MNELKLNIYNKKEIIKTYTIEYEYINTGIAEAIFELIDIDKFLSKTTTKEELGKELFRIVVKGWPLFKQVIIELCDGKLTEEEWKKTRSDEVVEIIIVILQNALSSLNSLGGNKKK